MIIELTLTLALLVGTLIGACTDIKKRYVPNFVSYSLIIIGLFGNLILSILNSSIYPFVYSAGLAGILYTLAYLLYRVGFWGGGDAKLLVAFGAVLPIYPKLFETIFNPLVAPWPFILTLWFNISIFGVVFGFLYALYLAIKHRKKFAPVAREMLHKYKLFIYLIFIMLMFVFASFLLSQDFGYFFAGIWASATLLFYLLVLMKSVETSCMFKFVRPSKLEEGDWVSQEINVDSFHYKPKKSGILLKEIQKLVELEKRGKLNQVKVKEGTPFVPSFLAGLLWALVFGDIIFSLVNAFI